MLYWEYPKSSQGKPVKRKERKYSTDTHKAGITKREDAFTGRNRLNDAQKRAT
jgi:hypothetical protein